MNTVQESSNEETTDITLAKTSRNTVLGTNDRNQDDRSEEDMDVDIVYRRQTTVYIAYDEGNTPNQLLDCVRKGLKEKGVSVLDDVTPGTQMAGETARAINEGTTCLFLLTRDAAHSPLYKLQVIQAMEKAQREGKRGGIILTNDIGDSDVSILCRSHHNSFSSNHQRYD
ncbi:uncharacterized protein LOC110458945 [Mizuhopecten yessoensis]|uniref:uncharacterized protein LOC110458945 n=1 Tax=Mizuhopecten yessoensis TaxID=6573 RepID=UPI000B459100|nr:uncharacterized protein LOC110458945 [Mizuhopecten yessoensis]